MLGIRPHFHPVSRIKAKSLPFGGEKAGLGLTRREFLEKGALSALAAGGLGMIVPTKSILPQESAQAQWPENMAVYRIQSKGTTGSARFTEALCKAYDHPEVHSLYEAAASAAKTQHQAVQLPTKAKGMLGWRKGDTKTERFLLILSGETHAPELLRHHMCDCEAKKLPNITCFLPYTQHNAFLDYLSRLGLGDLALAYTNKFKEQTRFMQGAVELLKLATQHLGVSSQNQYWAGGHFEGDALEQGTALLSNGNQVQPEQSVRWYTDQGLPLPNYRIHQVQLHYPSKVVLEKVLKQWMGANQHPDRELLVYYTGRANPTDDGAVLLHGTQPMSQEEVPITQWKQWFNDYASRFKHVALVMDTRPL